MNRARRRSEARLLAAMEQRFTSIARPVPSTVLWRWRYELLLAGLVVAVVAIKPWLFVAIAVLPALPPVRKLGWCAVTAHRVRTGCAEARIHSRGGRLPAVLLTSSTPYGQRVLLWCPAGVSVADFRSASAVLAAACWAADVRADASARYAHIVELRVVRRPERVPGAALAARARRHEPPGEESPSVTIRPSA